MAIDCRDGYSRTISRSSARHCKSERSDGADVFSPIVSLAVAIILFEGSSNLDFRELRGISKAVIRMITVGAAIAWILGAVPYITS